MTQRIVSLAFALALFALSAAPYRAAAMPQMKGDGAAEPADSGSTNGKVVETMDVGAYTYVLVDDGTKKTWAAAPLFPVAVGAQVTIPAGSPMTDFHSKTLDRTFDLIYFVDSIKVEGGTGTAPVAAHGAGKDVAAAHAEAAKAAEAPAVNAGDVGKAEGGQTIGELYAGKTELTGKDVSVRGKVVKFNKNILGKNWIHLQDGTGSAGGNDLTVTTDAVATVGDTVLVRGTLGADKDLGYGYKYEVIIEDAAVTVE